MTIVNTVVLVRERLCGTETDGGGGVRRGPGAGLDGGRPGIAPTCSIGCPTGR